MTGLDTNVLVRYLTQDDPGQARRASAFIEQQTDSGETFYVSTIVICELAWVLEDAYGYPPERVHGVLESVLRTAQFRFDAKDRLWQALDDARRGKADFSDYLIGRLGAAAGCESTATFDRALRGHALFRVL